MYKFKHSTTEQLFQNFSGLVQVTFEHKENMDVNASMDFDENRQVAIIKHKNQADEEVDITHELLHVRMEFKDGFTLLSWPKGDQSVTPDLKDTIKRIRNIVDDTYIFDRLHREFGIFPISQIFFREIRKDIRAGYIRNIQGLPATCKMLIGAWKLRIADFALNWYGSDLTTNQRRLSEDFLRRFSASDRDITNMFSFIRANVTPQTVDAPQKHGQALEKLPDELALPSVVHLASRQKQAGKWVLRRI